MPDASIQSTPATCGIVGHAHGDSPIYVDACVEAQASGSEAIDICRYCGFPIGAGHDEFCPRLRYRYL